MNYKLIFGAFSMKKAIEVYLFIYNGCKIEDYASFEDIRKGMGMSKYRLRILTNRMSRIGLIKSIQDSRYKDKRKKCYIVGDPTFAEKFYDFLNPNS